jgi:hypothetical protein
MSPSLCGREVPFSKYLGVFFRCVKCHGLGFGGKPGLPRKSILLKLTLVYQLFENLKILLRSTPGLPSLYLYS